MQGHIAGAYRCKADDRLYTYDARWEIAADRIHWNAAVKVAHAMIRTSGEMTFSEDDDVNGRVTQAVARWMENAVCTGVAAPASRQWAE
jgi:hypothetical protein